MEVPAEGSGHGIGRDQAEQNEASFGGIRGQEWPRRGGKRHRVLGRRRGKRRVVQRAEEPGGGVGFVGEEGSREEAEAVRCLPRHALF